MAPLHRSIEGVSFGMPSPSSAALRLTGVPKMLASKLSPSTSSLSASASSRTTPDAERDDVVDATSSQSTSTSSTAVTKRTVAIMTEKEGAEESALSRVTSELERERARRVELEERVARQLLAGSGTDDAVSRSDADASSVFASVLQPQPQAQSRHIDASACQQTTRETDLLRRLTALETERDGLRHMVDVVTRGSNNAVYYASKQKNEAKTLPPDAVRLLEIVPWEAAERYTSAVEEVYEWEMFDRQTGTWTGRYQRFPDDFRCVPVVKPRTASSSASTTSTMDRDEHTHFWTQQRRAILGCGDGGGGEADVGNAHPSEDCVLTDEDCTRVLDVSGGYPLPSAGTWEWVGEWRVDRRKKRKEGGSGTSGSAPPPCDADGWSYASQPKLLVSRRPGDCRATPGGNAAAGIAERRFRRRRWTRRRVLVSYPSASDMSEQFLALRAENARLTAGAWALEERVAELEGRLGEREEELRRLRQQRRQRLGEEEIAEERRRIAEEEERRCREVTAAAAAAAAPSCERVEVEERAAGILASDSAAPAEEEGELIIPPPPAKKRGVSLLGKYFLAKEGEDGTDGYGKMAKTVPPPAAEDLDAAPSLTLEMRSYAAASALKAAISKTGRKGVLLDRLYKINESVDRVRADQAESVPEDNADVDAGIDIESCAPALVGTFKPPATGISPSLHKLVQFGREDSGALALDDANTEPTATIISGEESEMSDTMSLLSEARSEISLAQRGRAAAAVGPAGGGRGVGGGAILGRILHKAGAPAPRAGMIDLEGVRRREISAADRWGDDDASIQVGKEIYVTNGEVACGGKAQPVPASMVQVLPFSSPTIRF